MNLFNKIMKKLGFGKNKNTEKISDGFPFENKFQTWEDYLYPGTNILKNKFNLKSYEYLALVENWYTLTITTELNLHPIEGNFDLEHLKTIHKCCFERVYEWAGQTRNVNIGKLDDNMQVQWFCPFKEIDSRIKVIFDKLKNENYLKGLDPNIFSLRAGYYLGEINSIHPFREGNGRTQRAFLDQIAQEAGYKISWKEITPEQMIKASIEAHKGNSAKLAELIKDNLKIYSAIEQK